MEHPACWAGGVFLQPHNSESAINVAPEGSLHAQGFCLVMLHIPLLQGSGEADSSGNPFGFMDENMPGAVVTFPALFTTEMSANRSADVLQYLLVSTILALLLQ